MEQDYQQFDAFRGSNHEVPFHETRPAPRIFPEVVRYLKFTSYGGFPGIWRAMLGGSDRAGRVATEYRTRFYT